MKGIVTIGDTNTIAVMIVFILISQMRNGSRSAKKMTKVIIPNGMMSDY